MTHWFHHTIVEPGRLPLFCFFVGMLVAFGFIRFSVRMIRAQVRWWPGNVQPGGVHIHHVVFGVVFMLVGGVLGLSLPASAPLALRAAAATFFGIGAALVLDEFALILHLRDVYWAKEGRSSVDAVFVAVALTGLLVLGVRPVGLADMFPPDSAWAVVVVFLLTLLVAMVTLLKGKLWAGLLGLFIPILLIVGAMRLARPQSPWARWRYGDGPKLAKAQAREARLRRPMHRAKVWLQDLIAGAPDR